MLCEPILRRGEERVTVRSQASRGEVWESSRARHPGETAPSPAPRTVVGMDRRTFLRLAGLAAAADGRSPTIQRNVSILVEIAARNHVLKLQGHHSAREFARKLEAQLERNRKGTTR